MRKKLPMSALISGLLAAPVLGAAPVMAETRVPIVVEQGALGGAAGAFPAEMPVEIGERMRRWARGERLNAHGMQTLQGKMAREVQARLAALVEGRIAGSLTGGQVIAAPAYVPAALVQADEVLTGEVETVAFLGVSASPVEAALGEQLTLSKGMGLMVDYVEKDSPADKAGIKVHDVLEKLDEQYLINREQFLVLVRAKKPGDAVTLTVIHAGKRSPVRVTLGEHQVPLAMNGGPMPTPGFIVGANPAPGIIPIPGMIPPGPGGVTEHSAGMSIAMNPDGSVTRKVVDDQNEITLNKGKDGKETLTVMDREGHTFYEGDPAGAEKSAQLSDAVKGKVRNLIASPNAVTIRIGGPEQGGGMASQKITMERRDQQHDITLHIDAAGRGVVVKDVTSGNTLYQGGISEEDFKKMPAGVAEKVKAMLEKLK